MADVTTATADRPARRNGAAHGLVLVSGVKLAAHFGISRQAVDQLTAAGVIERRSDGLFDQDVSRLKYMTHLRTNRRSQRSEADADFQRAKAELIRLRIDEKQKILMPVAEHDAFVDRMVGLLLSRLSGFPARCGGRDLQVRREIERAVYDLRKEISEAASKLADESGEPPEDAEQ